MNFPNAILLLFLICLLGACGGPKNPEFKGMKQVKFKSVLLDEGLGVTMKADALLFNPNPMGVHISGIEFDVFAEGTKMTRIRQELSVKMKASSDFLLPLEFDIPLSGVIEKFKNPSNLLEMAKRMEVPIQVKGHIKVSIAGSQLRIPVNYEEPYSFTPASLLGK